MIKYKRRTINQKPELHDKEFVTVDDVHELMIQLTKVAIKAGADEAKMMELFSDKTNN